MSAVLVTTLQETFGDFMGTPGATSRERDVQLRLEPASLLISNSGANDRSNDISCFWGLIEEPEHEAKLRDELRGYVNLPDDWDGDDGHAPDQVDIDNAIRFMSHIPKHALSVAESMVSGDGDVGFLWKASDHHLEIGFRQGEISFYGEAQNGEEIYGDKPFDHFDPEKLLQFINTVFPR